MTGSNIQKVVDGRLCIGCGVCAAQNHVIRITDSALGLTQASLSKTHDMDTAVVCPFAAQLSEDDLINNVAYFDERMGRFVGVYVEHVSDNAQASIH